MTWVFAPKTGNYLNPSSWHEATYDQAIFPIIPYSANYRDTENIHFKSPFGPQNMTSNQSWHWLGTDQYGKDVAAGIIGGVRVCPKGWFAIDADSYAYRFIIRWTCWFFW